MQLPSLQLAIAEERKLRDYLLSESRTEGKAAFFVKFGFAAADWEILREALLLHASTNEVASAIRSPHGVKYIVEGALHTPDGRNPEVRAVWIIENGTVGPRLVTAYPL